MKKVLFVMTLMIAVLFGCASADKADGGFLWKAENGDTTVYLQGTIHVGNEDFYPLNEQIEDAYEKSDVVLPEIDLNGIDEAELLPMTIELATYEEGKTIRDVMSKDMYDALDEILQENSVPIEMIEHFRPWFLETMIMQLALEKSEYSPDYGVDSYFLDRAAEDGKEVRELESYEDQMTMLSGFSDDLQLELLANTISNYDNMASELNELATYWQNGDLDELNATTEEESESFDGYEEYMEEMNTNRNIDMADTIVELLDEDSGQTYFVIVGAMHLVEEPSIVSLIEEAGFDVEHVY